MFETFLTPESLMQFGFAGVTAFLLWERMNDRKLQTEELKEQHNFTRSTIEANTLATNKLCILIDNNKKVV